MLSAIIRSRGAVCSQDVRVLCAFGVQSTLGMLCAHGINMHDECSRAGWVRDAVCSIHSTPSARVRGIIRMLPAHGTLTRAVCPGCLLVVLYVLRACFALLGCDAVKFALAGCCMLK